MLLRVVVLTVVLGIGLVGQAETSTDLPLNSVWGLDHTGTSLPQPRSATNSQFAVQTDGGTTKIFRVFGGLSATDYVQLPYISTTSPYTRVGLIDTKGSLYFAIDKPQVVELKHGTLLLASCSLKAGIVRIGRDHTCDSLFSTKSPFATGARIRGMYLDEAANRLYVAGSFTSVGSLTNVWLVVLDTVTGLVVATNANEGSPIIGTDEVIPLLPVGNSLYFGSRKTSGVSTIDSKTPIQFKGGLSKLDLRSGKYYINTAFLPSRGVGFSDKVDFIRLAPNNQDLLVEGAFQTYLGGEVPDQVQLAPDGALKPAEANLMAPFDYTYGGSGSYLQPTQVGPSDVQLTWKEKSDAKGYFLLISRTLTNGVFTNFQTLGYVPAGTTTFRVPSLRTDGTQYRFALSATDGYRRSNLSVKGFVLEGVPRAPQLTTILPQSTTSVVLTWLDNSNVEETFTAESLVNGVWGEVGTVLANKTTLTVAVPAESIREFRIRAKNSLGVSYSNIQSVSTKLPAAPTAFAASTPLRLVKTFRTNLTWKDNATDESHYVVEMKTATGSWTKVFPPTLPTNATSYLAEGLQAATTYSFRVMAAKPWGLSAPATISLTTPR